MPSAQEPRAPATSAAPSDARAGLKQIRPGHYVYIHTDGAPGVSSTFNSGIIVTDEGVMVIDALSSEAIARNVRAAIAGITPQPVRYLVSSTFHDRFTGGNAVYHDAFRLGHEGYQTDLSQLLQKEPLARRRAMMPHQTYRDRVTFSLGGKEIQVRHLGRAHTRGDSVVFVPEDRIVYMSEVFFHEEFPYTADAYPSEWIATLQAAEALDADVFVPGHGFLPDNLRETRQGLRRHQQILADLRAAVQQQVARGASEDQTVANVDLPQYRRFKGYSQALPIGVRRAYQELTAGLR